MRFLVGPRRRGFGFLIGGPSTRCRPRRLRSIVALAAYFHLRKLGYTMVARNFRTARCRGEIDLIGWEDDVLCFVEVKTRTTRDVKPGEAAVDGHKRREGAAVVQEYLRRLPPSCQWRFDLVSVYYQESKASQPRI